MKNSLRISLLIILFSSAFSGNIHSEDYSLRFYDDSDGLSHWHLSQIIQDNTGMVWVATWNGLNRFDGTEFVTFKPELGDGVPIHGDRIRRMRLTDDNNLLCMIDDRVFLFNTRTCTFDTLPNGVGEAAQEVMQPLFNPNYARPKEKFDRYGSHLLRNIRSEYKDRQNNLWLINEYGVYVATPILSHGRRINQEEMRCMRRMQNGDIWMAVRNNRQLMVYDSSLNLRGYMDSIGRLHQQPVEFGSAVYSICETRNGRILLGSKPGCMMEYKMLTDQRYAKIQTYPELRNVYDICEDNDGRLWIATYGFGLWASLPSEADNQPSTFARVPGTENKCFRRLLTTPDGTLLAATTSGLMVLDANGLHWHQREANDPHSISSSAVMCLCMFRDRLYVGTEGGGINRLIGTDLHAEQMQWENLKMQDGLETDIVFEIVPWSETELLLQGNTTLTVLDVTMDKDEVVPTICNYGRSFFGSSTDDKLILGEVPPVILPDDRILIAPASGIVLLDKAELKQENDSIRIALNMVRCGDSKPNYAVDELKRITLAADERDLIMMFSALDFRSTGAVFYSSRFFERGKEDHPWDPPTKMNAIVLANLHPGEYVFEVRSTNVYGQWQDNTRRIYITVTPTFWESTAGWILQIGLLLLIVIAIAIQSTRVHYHRKRRAEMLDVYLDMQERYLLVSDQQAALRNQMSDVSNQQPEPLPVPEILAPGYTSENEKFLNTLHAFMEQHISDNNMTIDDIARVTCMSRSSLNRKMHELFNLSAKDFVQAARIKHACNLLRTTDMAAKEVAYACGFSDPRYFSKSFKANIGKTPTEYREEEIVES